MLDGDPDFPMGRGNFGYRGAHCKVQGLSAISCAKTAEPIDLPFGLWTLVVRRKQKLLFIRTQKSTLKTSNLILGLRNVCIICDLWYLF